MTEEQQEGAAPSEVTLADILAEQQAHRAEVAALRDQINALKRPQVSSRQDERIPSPEEALANRLAEVEQVPFYCPGCGRLWKYMTECIGTPQHPHPAIEVVSTDELKSGDPTQHTAMQYVVAR